MCKCASGFIILGVACAVGGCQSGNNASGSGGPNVRVNPAVVQARAKAPPPASATARMTIGAGALMVQTANSPSDTDSYWVEQLDIDGDGVLETTQLLWDDEDKMLFAYSETDVVSGYGGMAMVSILAGVNGQGNPRGRPAGSGFYAVFLDASECGAAAAGLYACEFNAAGVPTVWAGAAVDSAGDQVSFFGAR